MASTNDLKNGMVLSIDNGLWSVVEFQHVKPGKGPAFVRTKLKNVESNKTVDKTFNAGTKVETATVDRRTIIIGLMLLMIGSCILAAIATSIAVLLLARAILGVAPGGFYGLTTAVALRIVPSAQVPRAISMIAMGVSLAIVFATPLHRVLTECRSRA